jgi:hypothetical protein
VSMMIQTTHVNALWYGCVWQLIRSCFSYTMVNEKYYW